MKTISDYIFSTMWQLATLGLQPNATYSVLADLGDLRKGDVVTFVGFDDVDNHYGIFVFTDANGSVLEVSGDFSGPQHTAVKNLKAALIPSA